MPRYSQVRLVIGDVRSRTQLVRAGIRHAQSIVVLSGFRGAGTTSVNDSQQCDMDATLLYAKVQKVIMAGKQSTSSAPDTFVLTEVHDAKAIRLLDETSWWPADERDDFSFVQVRSFSIAHLRPILGTSMKGQHISYSLAGACVCFGSLLCRKHVCRTQPQAVCQP